MDQEQAELRALSLFGSAEAIQAFADEVEDVKNGRRFADAEELMNFLDALVAAKTAPADEVCSSQEEDPPKDCSTADER